MWKKNYKLQKKPQNYIVTQYMYVNAEYLVMTSHSSIFEFCSTFGSWNVTTFLNDSTEVCCSRDSNTQLPACGVNALSHHTFGNEDDYAFLENAEVPTSINRYMHVWWYALYIIICTSSGLLYYSNLEEGWIIFPNFINIIYPTPAESCLLSRKNRFLI